MTRIINWFLRRNTKKQERRLSMLGFYLADFNSRRRYYR